MGLGDKIGNKAEEVKGKAKEKVGDATDNPEMHAEGKGEKYQAEAKQVGEKMKDVGHDAKDDLDR